MAEPVLVAKGLLAQGAPAGAGLDLVLRAGALCCVIGPADTGKSAWMQALAGVSPPAGGQLRLAGRDCASLDRAGWRALRTKVAYVSTATPLLSVLGGMANVTLPALYHGIASGPELERRARVWLDRLGWEGPLDKLPAYLTRHQRCLLVLARCLLLEPAVLFVNEPFLLTDASGWRHLATLFVRLAREFGLAQVLLLHDLTFVQHHAKRILFTSPSGIREYVGWGEFTADRDDAARNFRMAAELDFAGD